MFFYTKSPWFKALALLHSTITTPKLLKHSSVIVLFKAVSIKFRVKKNTALTLCPCVIVKYFLHHNRPAADVVMSNLLHLTLDQVAEWGSGFEDIYVSEKYHFLAFAQICSSSVVKKVQCRTEWRKYSKVMSFLLDERDIACRGCDVSLIGWDTILFVNKRNYSSCGSVYVSA